MADYWTRLDNEPPVREIAVERTKSGWIRVYLDGERVWQRLTRDKAFTRVAVGFRSNRSPYVPKSREAYDGCALGGAWRPRRYGWSHLTANGFVLDLPPFGETFRWAVVGDGALRVFPVDGGLGEGS